MSDPVTETKSTTEGAGGEGTDAARPPAPGGLSLVQELVNTLDIEAGEDELATPGAATRWLHEHGLLPRVEPVDDDGLRALVEVREALRDLASVNGGAPLPASTLATLQRHSEASPVRIRIDGDSSDLVPARTGVQGAIARLLGLVHDAQHDGSWSRLKVCRDDACRWAFYDASRNRSGTWCSMAVCGNRAKARAFRRRHT